jgi:hypothetical protein
MELAGMVQMGEYSSGCICEVRKRAAQPSSDGGSGSLLTPSTIRSAITPALVGVWTQMQRQRQSTAFLPVIIAPWWILLI